MEVQCPMAQIPIEGLHEEHRFGVLSGNILKNIRINQLESYRVKLRRRLVAQ